MGPGGGGGGMSGGAVVRLEAHRLRLLSGFSS